MDSSINCSFRTWDKLHLGKRGNGHYLLLGYSFAVSQVHGKLAAMANGTHNGLRNYIMFWFYCILLLGVFKYEPLRCCGSFL
jgi:hypothetical protein